VRVGSLSDPDSVQGLAHFVEHMLFYASEKYPTEDEYSKFIAERGGSTNAYTANESTNYQFDINCESLPEALDRFAQFFISPTLSVDGVEREAKAVDSEHGKNLNSDAWKQLQLWKTVSNPDHPFSRFSTGNYKTLCTGQRERGMCPRDAVSKFYEDQYSSNRMKLVVLGRHSLDELEDMVRTSFEPVKNKSLHPAKIEVDLLLPDNKGILIKTVPEKAGHTLEIQWLTVSEEKFYRKCPLHYISHLLGHEGDGSLFALIREEGWANALSSGEAATSLSTHSFFSVKIDLTEKGWKNLKTIFFLIFRYIDLIRESFADKEPKAKSIWHEMKSLAELRFNFKDKMNVFSYVSALSHAMQVYSLEDLLEAMYNVPLEYDASLILDALEDLTPEIARVLCASKSLEAECSVEKEIWYGTPYSIQKIPEDWLEQCRVDEKTTYVSKLFLPDLNDFIPTDFSLASEYLEYPELAMEKPSSCQWMRPDPSFKIPKAILYIEFRLPEAYKSPVSATCTQLLVKLVNDKLTEVSYPAQLAGLHYTMRATKAGILLGLNGYHHTIGRLAQLVTKTLIELEVQPERFEYVQKRLEQEYINTKFEQPYRLCLYELDIALEHTKWHVNDYEAILPTLSAHTLQQFVPTLFSSCCVVSLCAGNMPKSISEEIIQEIEGMMVKKYNTRVPAPSEVHESRLVDVKAGSAGIIKVTGPNSKNENSAVVIGFQGHGVNSSTKMQLLAHMGKRDAFYQLRTTEQLGYIVFFSTYATLTCTNLVILIQSSEYSAAHMDNRIMHFLQNSLQEKIANMKAEEFKESVDELVKVKLEKPKRLQQKCLRDWAEIQEGTLRFDRHLQEVEALRALAQSDFMDFVNTFIIEKSSRKMLRVHVQSQQSERAENGYIKELETPGTQILDVFQWKREQSLLPSSYDEL